MELIAGELYKLGENDSRYDFICYIGLINGEHIVDNGYRYYHSIDINSHTLTPVTEKDILDQLNFRVKQSFESDLYRKLEKEFKEKFNRLIKEKS